MNKFISLMNPATFYYIWHSKYKYYLVDLINNILKKQEEYILLNTFNKDNFNLRSYIFLENKNKIIYIDFNNINNEIIKFLNLTSSKKLYVIIFNSVNGKNTVENNIFEIYKNKDNTSFLNLYLSESKKEQGKFGYKKLLKYIYDLDNDFYLFYLKEQKYL
ncbi:MAG: hypothetical protein PHF21_01025 [Bacilli bacterium]|nr:hypothetical protein [Bacilli bacterium]